MKRIIMIGLLIALCVTAAGCSAPAEETTEPVTVGAVFDGSLTLGDTMPDLTVTTAKGRTVTLYGLLEKKDLVVLNFWYANCGWCMKEFPSMEVAYQSRKADVELLALNSVDTAAQVEEFQTQRSLSFPMAVCSRELSLGFGVNAYPTSVFIDRSGTVCLIHVGAITDVNTWRSLMDAFTGEDYQTKIYSDIQEVLGQ